MMNGKEDVSAMSRDELEHEVKILRLFNESYLDIIKLTCKKVDYKEAYLWGNFVQVNTDYWLHPEPNKSNKA